MDPKIPHYIYEIASFMIDRRYHQHRVADDLFNLRKIRRSNHMCAILDKNGNPIVFGSNYFLLSEDETEHAESDALTKLNSKIGRVSRRKVIDIIIIRTTCENSKPCDNCMQKIRNANNRFHVRNIYFSINNGIDYMRFNKC